MTSTYPTPKKYPQTVRRPGNATKRLALSVKFTRPSFNCTSGQMRDRTICMLESQNEPDYRGFTSGP
jgi:hypothetical protein